MNKTDYELIINSLQKHVDDCHIHLDSITSTDSLLKMTGEELIKLMEFAKTEVFSMTKILMVDLYHIIGMGNMSPIQETKFLKLVKEYCKFRSDLKAIASNLRDLNNLPKLPTASKFRLTELCDLVLTSEVRTGSEAVETIDESCINDYREARGATVIVPNEDLTEIKLSDNVLTFTAQANEEELKSYLKILGYNYSLAKVIELCQNGPRHLNGLSWCYFSEGNYFQIIARTNRTKNRFQKIKKLFTIN